MVRNTLLLAAVLAGCAAQDPHLAGVASSKVTAGELDLHTFFALPPFTDAPMPVYTVVVNRGSVPDTLEGASSPASARVMIHGGSMAELAALPIPAGDSLVLAPGQLHLMLLPPVPALVRGDSVEVILRFTRTGPVRLMVPVIDYVDADAVR